MGDNEYVTILRREFSGEEDTFLFQLHYRAWDWEAFNQLTDAMLACCQDYDASKPEYEQLTLFGTNYERAQLPRWLVEGFWYVLVSTEGYTPDPSQDGKDAEYPQYMQAHLRVRSLAEWFFTGASPYRNPSEHFKPR